MSKPSAVTQEDVNSIVIEFLSQGQMPSINVVQAELKKRLGFAGGTQVVTRMISSWKEQAAKTLSQKVRPGIPEELSVAADKFVMAAMDHASELLNAEAEEIRKSGLEHKAECEKQVAKANSDTLQFQSLLEKTVEALKVATSKISTLEVAVETCHKDIDTISTECNSFRDQAFQQSGVIQQLREDAVQTASHHSDILSKKEVTYNCALKEIQAFHSQELTRIEQKYQSQINQERESLAEDKKRLYLEIDSKRQEMKQQSAKDAAALGAQQREIESIRKTELELRKESQTLRERNAFLEGSFKSMESELERVRKLFDTVSSQNSLLIAKVVVTEDTST